MSTPSSDVPTDAMAKAKLSDEPDHYRKSLALPQTLGEAPAAVVGGARALTAATGACYTPAAVENMLEEADLDIMARINAQNDAKDRENAERAAASKCPGCVCPTPPSRARARPQRTANTPHACRVFCHRVAERLQSSAPSWW